MMMDTVCDPYELFFGDEQTSPSIDGLLFPNEVMFGNFNTDSSSISPISNTMDNTETDFDPAIFDKLLNELLSADPLTLKETSVDIPFTLFEPEPTTREAGTDPMEPAPPTLPIIIKTTNANQLTNAPIFLIKKISTTPTEHVLVTTGYYDLPLESSLPTANDYTMDDNLTLTPSPSSDSHDETSSNSPGSSQDKIYSKLLTNLDNLPKTGSFALTNEEIKIMKQEGYPIPTKLPLSKNEEKLLKKVRRKIKNKISAQESRRKKKDYVNTLEKQIAKYLDENSALKEHMTAIEKNQKTLTQERDLLRSMISKGTPTPSTALMVFAVFFAVLFGIWSPITSKSAIDDKSLSLENALIPSKNYQSAFTSQKSLFDQQENTHSNYITDNYKSRVLLSADEYDHHHHHGPYLPSNNKYKSIFQQQTPAPGYTYSSTVEKYMNKKIKSDQLSEDTNDNQNFKRSFLDESPSIQPTYKKVRSNYHQNEKIVVIEETNDHMNNGINESKSVKIIRVERTIPAIGNDTLKLAQRTINE